METIAAWDPVLDRRLTTLWWRGRARRVLRRALGAAWYGLATTGLATCGMLPPIQPH